MAITHYEARGRTPDMNALLAISRVLGVSLADLLRHGRALPFEHGGLRKGSAMGGDAQSSSGGSCTAPYGRTTRASSEGRSYLDPSFNRVAHKCGLCGA